MFNTITAKIPMNPILKLISILLTTFCYLSLSSHSISAQEINLFSQNLNDLNEKPIDKMSDNILGKDIKLTLRSLAQKHNFFIGSAVNVKALRKDFLYRDRLSREFNIITAENAMKFKRLHPKPKSFDFSRTDYLMAFASANKMQVRGHTLVWHNALPDWLKEGDWTRDELIDILENHIKTVVGRYRGRIIAWDVVNEAVADDGTLRNSFWLERIGPEYIEMAFRWAYEADPNALLIYNDYGAEGLNRKSDAIYRLIKSLVANNVPIHGIGLQMHIQVDSPPNVQDVAKNMSRFTNLGLQVHITEMDVRIKKPSLVSDFQQQAKIYRDILRTCLLAEKCNTFVTWGFSDRYSWIPKHFKGWGDALLLNKNYQAKPAYYKLLKELADYQKQ